jgi:hypothetical protein
LSEATKKKISESVLKTHSDNVDENGNIKSSEEREKNKKRKSENFDEDGNRIKKSRMLSYNKIKHEYEIRGCRLLTTEDEYYSLRTTMDIRNIHFKIVSSCGHEMGSLYYGLIVDETGVVCKQCKFDAQVINMSNNSKTADGHTTSSVIQLSVINKIKERCPGFDVQKIRDGCSSDIIVKPISSADNRWLKIKVKSCSHPYRYSGFRVVKKYDGVVYLMMYVKTDKTHKFHEQQSFDKCWIVTPDELELKVHYMDSNPKYDKYLTRLDDLSRKLMSLYELDIYNSDSINANMPISPAMKVEYQFVLKRTQCIPYLKFEQNNMMGLSYNFKIDHLKVQEIVCSKMKHKVSYFASLNKNSGKGKRSPYDVGDNNIYWININDQTTEFYVIPENVLVNISHITTPGQNGKTYLNILKQYEIIHPYLFHYSTINTEEERTRLINLIQFIKNEQ